VDSNVTRSRGDRAQLSVLLDKGLLDVVRVVARGRGMTVVAFVERALEVSVDGYVGVGSDGGVGVAVGGGAVGQVGERGGGGYPVVTAGGVDPLEEIA
jgi:hypothetical protein